MRRFVIGDIHGAHRALLQCFGKSGFDRQNDLLICLGDLCDGWPDADKVFDELLQVRNLILIMGNHDLWLMNWFNTGVAEDIWLIQGGRHTVEAFKNGVSTEHKQLLNSSKLYYMLENRLFVHGGFQPDKPLEQQDKTIFLWDRSLVQKALQNRQLGTEHKITQFDRVYVGHTPTINFHENKPIFACGIYLMDTGAGWPGGQLSMMDIDNDFLYASSCVDELYQNTTGRKNL